MSYEPLAVIMKYLKPRPYVFTVVVAAIAALSGYTVGRSATPAATSLLGDQHLEYSVVPEEDLAAEKDLSMSFDGGIVEMSPDAYFFTVVVDEGGATNAVYASSDTAVVRNGETPVAFTAGIVHVGDRVRVEGAVEPIASFVRAETITLLPD